MKASRHKFEIKGLNQERFFNNLSKKYEIYDLDRVEKNRSFFSVKFMQANKVKKEILAAGFEILTESSSGILHHISKLLTSFGLIAGLAVVVLGYSIQSPFLQKIEVVGVQNTQEIVKFVKGNLSTRRLSQIDTDLIERLIRENFEDTSFVSAAIIGQSLLINVKDAIVPPEMNSTFKPIVSEYDGIITGINLIQGTKKVEVGDIIQKGQVLVEGYVTNSEGEVFQLPPRAEIFMDVWIEETITHFDKQIVTSRTGKMIEKVCVTLFGHEFYSNNKQNTFDSFETETFTKPLIQNNILPFMVTTTRYFETITQTIETNFEDVQEQIIAEARANCLQKIEDCDIIANENYYILQGPGMTTVKYVITLNLCIKGENESLH